MKTTYSTSIIIIFIMNALLAVVTAVGMTIAPFMLVENLGVSLVLLGAIEGVMEMSGSLIKLLSGVVFDKVRNVKKLFWLSTLMSFLAKLLLFIPNSLTIVLSKGLERIGNGMFATPRDAYVLEHTSKRGLTYSLLSTSKTLGCVAGSLLVSGLVYISNDTLEHNLSFILAISCGLALFASFLSFLIKNNAATLINSGKSFNIIEAKDHLVTCLKDKKMQLKLIPIYLGAFMFFLGRFNDGMLMFYLKEQGAPSWLYLSTISIFNTAMFIIAPIFGYLVDKKYTGLVLKLTIFSLIIFNLIFMFLSKLPDCFVFIGLALWGVQRTGAAIIFAYLLFQKSDNKAIYGTNLGILMFVMGLGSLIGSITAGHLCSMDFRHVFLFSAICASLSGVACSYIGDRK